MENKISPLYSKLRLSIYRIHVTFMKIRFRRVARHMVAENALINWYSFRSAVQLRKKARMEMWRINYRIPFSGLSGLIIDRASKHPVASVIAFYDYHCSAHSTHHELNRFHNFTYLHATPYFHFTNLVIHCIIGFVTVGWQWIFSVNWLGGW